MRIAPIDRRTFATTLAGTLAAARMSRAQSRDSHVKTVFYAAVGPALTLYDVDVDGATLSPRTSITLPANIHYAWLHPSKRYFYVASSNGGPGTSGIVGDRHYASAYRVDLTSGSLSPHGQVRTLPSRPIHISVDNAGEYVLTAHNNPSSVLVHRINRDGSLGDVVKQPTTLDTGIYAHQIRTTPSNRTAILVTRGNNAASGKPEDPGALKVFGFKNGVLTNMASIAPGGGIGFGPRHLDFHPRRPFVFVSIERQSQIHVYRLESDGGLSPQPLFVKSTLANPGAASASGDGASTIHLHPNGRFAYIPNRASSTVRLEGNDVFAGGDNTIAVFDINEETGEPTLHQNVDGHGVQLRTFGIDPTGRLLAAASIMPILVRGEGGRLNTLTAGLSVYRIGGDGRLTFARKLDVDTRKGTQFWSGMVTLG